MSQDSHIEDGLAFPEAAASTPDTQIITFYSYKGGVGRTMAMANAACQLANVHGLNVIVVDWDLEAPGLHYYFGYSDDELSKQAGLIDFLEDFVHQVKRGSEGSAPNLDEYLVGPKPEIAEKIKFGSVRILTCGRTDARYMLRVRSFDWDRFYDDYSGFQIIETLKKQLRTTADITLVDARSGQSDIGATPTIQLPDAVVLLFTSNRQSLEGTARIARFLKQHPMRREQGFADLRLLLVPSRVFYGEAKYNTWVQGEAASIYSQLLADKIAIKDDQPEGLNQCALVIDPDVTVGEALPVLEANDETLLRTRYQELAGAIADLHAGRKLWSPLFARVGRLNDDPVDILSHFRPWTPSQQVAPRSELYEMRRRAQLRSDEYQIARLNYQIGISEFRNNRDASRNSFAAALAYFETKRDVFRSLATKLWLCYGQILDGDLTSAQSLASTALQEAREFGEPLMEVRALMHLGRISHDLGQSDEQTSYYRQAMEISEALGDPELQGVILHNMGHVEEDQYRFAAAEQYYRRSLSLARSASPEHVLSKETELENYFCLSRILRKQHNYSASAEMAREMLQLSEGLEDRNKQAMALYSLGQTLSVDGKKEEALVVFGQALQIQREEENPAGQLANLEAMAEVEIERGRQEEARKLLDEDIALATSTGNAYSERDAYLSLGRLEESRRDFDAAAAAFQKAVSAAERLDDPHSVSVARRYLASALDRKGQYEEAKNILKEIIQQFEKEGDVRQTIITLHRLGHLEESHKSYEEAAKYFSNCLDLSRQIHADKLITENLHCLGTIYVQLKKHGDAAEMFRESFTRAKIEGDLLIMSTAASWLADSLGRLNNFDEAISLMKSVIEIDNESPRIIDQLSMLASLHLAKGDLESSKQVQLELVNILKARSDPSEDLSLTYGRLARLELKLGDLEAAKRNLAMADEVVSSLKEIEQSSANKLLEKIRADLEGASTR